MSQQQYMSVIEKELRELNRRIDFKIVHGEKYGDDSRRHKVLLSKLRNLQKTNLITRLFSFSY